LNKDGFDFFPENYLISKLADILECIHWLASVGCFQNVTRHLHRFTVLRSISCPYVAISLSASTQPKTNKHILISLAWALLTD